MIAVIDYGMGNLHSIAKALEYVGGEVTVTADHSEIAKADRIVLPGVGAFGDGVTHLRETGLDRILGEEVHTKRKPFWGICLGMQLLAKTSEEFGTHEGLGWVDAEVQHFRFGKGSALKVPHVGWNTVHFTQEHPILVGISDADFYFVHSYHLAANDTKMIIGTCDYGGEFTAAITKENIFATQFHPEKSQKTGLAMLKNFLTWSC